MKKIYNIIIVLIAILGFSIPIFLNISHAQDFNFNKAYQDYQYNLTLYDQSTSDFKNSKSAYLMNSTLALKEDLRLKALNMLVVRDTLMSVYLTMLRMKIVENKGLTNDEKNGIYSKIDPEVEWYDSDKSKYSSSDSLETLFTRNEDSKIRYQTNTVYVIDEALVYIGLGQEIDLRIQHEQIYSGLKSLIDSGISSGKLILTPFNNWFNDINTTGQQLKQNEDGVREAIVKYNDQSHYNQNSCEACTDLLSSSITPLSKFNVYLTEILNYIRNQR